MDDLAEKTGVPKPTLYGWVVKGRLKAPKEKYREGGKRKRWLVEANPDTLNAIRSWRDKPARHKLKEHTLDLGTVPTAH